MSKKLTIEEPTLNLFADGDNLFAPSCPPFAGDASEHLQRAVFLAAAVRGVDVACAAVGQAVCNGDKCPLWLDPCF